MNSMHRSQRGASALGIIIILAIIGAVAYVGLQYIPQYIEAGTVDSILSNIEQSHEETPVSSTRAIRDMIDKQLGMNQLEGLRDNFKVTRDGETYIVSVSYERELNLLYEQRPINYDKTITLR